MQTLITPSRVLKLAFGGSEPLAADAITESDIAAAEQRYLIPVIGSALHTKLLSGGYAPFLSDYLAAPTALFTRLLIQPRLDIRTGQCGTTAPQSASFRAADTLARRRQQQSLLSQARTLLRRAADHLAAHPTEFPEYDPHTDITKRCTIDGCFVQTR
ncbi:MAG: hypothetical protein RRY33_00045 [Alistipes sp.]